MFKKIKELLLNTPEQYWLIVNGYHIHKSFWGVILILTSLILTLNSYLFIATIIFIFGILLLGLSIFGNIYTKQSVYIRLIDKIDKK